MSKHLVGCETHSHFWVKDGIVYESYHTIRGLRYRAIVDLKCHYPDKDKLTPTMIEYLNNYLAQPDVISKNNSGQINLF